MKKVIIVSSFLSLLTVTAGAQLRQQLLNRLSAIQTRGYMVGHQDDPFYGMDWNGDLGRSDTKDAVGDYPAVMGFELGGIEMDDVKNLDSVPFTRIRQEIIAHAERGGIVTVSWHPRNPYTGGTAWDNADSVVVKGVLPGGSQHLKFLNWMKRVGRFLKTLRTANDRHEGLFRCARQGACSYQTREGSIRQESGAVRQEQESLQGQASDVKKSKSPGMKTFMRTIKEREEDLLNYYETFVTNASAESLNSGIKGFRAELHGISNLSFFFYRVRKIYG